MNMIFYTRKISTRSARIRALFGVPMPTAISLTPDESNLALASFKVEASSQLEIRTNNCSHQNHKVGVTKKKKKGN